MNPDKQAVITQRHFDDAMDDVTHAVLQVLRTKGLVTASYDEWDSLADNINDALTAVLRPAIGHQAPVVFAEHARVRTLQSTYFQGRLIAAGTVGVVVDIHPDGWAYEVEFDLKPVCTVTVSEKLLELVHAD